ncbi:MAG TPA: hypothetical protein VFF27_16290 [Bacteroidia bacterium]|jgi:outer membrane biosynthesis protein TonB|nr:hypothetical protein [Bacteroidia bacterium]
MSGVPLEELVKNSLATYEARYDSNDWTRMETMLGTTPDSSPFNWKPVIIVAIVLGLLGGGYLAFTSIDFSKPTAKSKPVETPAVVKKQPAAPVKKEVPPPAPVVAPIVNTDSIKKAEEAAAAAALAAKEEEERQQREIAEKEEARLKKEKRREKEQTSSKEEVDLRRVRRRTFDSPDSNKTTQSTSKEEKVSEKKEKNTHIGLNIFSTLNADSLKKALEKSKKDSVK